MGKLPIGDFPHSSGHIHPTDPRIIHLFSTFMRALHDGPFEISIAQKKTFWRASWHPFFLCNDEISAVYQPKRWTTNMKFYRYLTPYRSIMTTWTTLKRRIGKKVDEADVTGQNARDSGHSLWKYILLFDTCNQNLKNMRCDRRTLANNIVTGL